MAPENSDERIRRLFEELRASDRRLIPPFPRVWQQAMALRARPRWSVRAWIPAAMAAVAVAAITIVTLFHLVSSSRYRATDSTNLAEWRSPTAYLLRYPGQEFYRDTSELNLPLESYSRTDWSRKL